MKTSYNKNIFFLIGTYLIITRTMSDLNLLLVLVMLSLSAFIELTQNKVLSLLYLIPMLFSADIRLFLPLFILDAPLKMLLMGLPFIIYLPDRTLILLSLFSLIIRSYTTQTKTLTQSLLKLQDETRYREIRSQKEVDLLNTHYEHELLNATLHERNRIARDIHDSVGHKLSSSIIQIGALELLNQQEDLTPPIHNLRETLDSAMDAIRQSVHQLHNESINLKEEVSKLLEIDEHLDIDYKFTLEKTPSNQITTTLLFIIKEALQNLHKHSDATQLKLHLSQSLDSIQLLIHDNGTVSKQQTHFGLGMTSMSERVKEQNGIINIQTENGFRIYVSIPHKEIL